MLCRRALHGARPLLKKSFSTASPYPFHKLRGKPHLALSSDSYLIHFFTTSLSFWVLLKRRHPVSGSLCRSIMQIRILELNYCSISSVARIRANFTKAYHSSIFPSLDRRRGIESHGQPPK